MTSPFQQFAPWSISKSDLAAKCPFAFKLQYIDNLPRVSGTHARIGTAAHTAQEHVLKHEPPQTALETAFAEEPDLTPKEQKEVIALLPAIEAYYDRMQRYKERKGITVEFFEKKWAINEDFQPVDYYGPDVFFRGAVDHCMLTPDGYLLIIDHKSGRDRGLSYYQKQLDAYAILGMANVPGIKGVQAALHYMKSKNLIWHAMRRTSDIKGMLHPWLVGLLKARAERLEPYAPNPTFLCKWCDHREHCPEGLAYIEASALKRKPANRKPKQCP